MATFTNIEQKHFFNEFDEFGALLGVERLPGEKNADFKRRILSALVTKANVTRQGLFNHMKRALDIEEEVALTISVSNSSMVDPAIVVDESKVTLYSHLRNDTKVLEFNKRTNDSDDNYLHELVSAINNDGNFSASLAPGMSAYKPCKALVPNRSRTLVFNQPIERRHVVNLGHTNIVPNLSATDLTFQISASDTTLNEQSSLSNMTSAGDYYVDYTNGIIYFYSEPIELRVSYEYDTLPLDLTVCDISITSLQTDAARDLLFRTLYTPDGTKYHARLTPLGASLINEAISEFPYYW